MKVTKRVAVYIASPYTKGDVAINVRESLLVADKLLDLGFLPFCPLLSHFWHLISPKPYSEWMTMDLEWILRCDALLRLPGRSSGADDEYRFAKQHGIPVFLSIEDLKKWSKGEANVKRP